MLDIFLFPVISFEKTNKKKHNEAFFLFWNKKYNTFVKYSLSLFFHLILTLCVIFAFVKEKENILYKVFKACYKYLIIVENSNIIK